MLRNLIRSYWNLPRMIHMLIMLEFTLSLIHVAFILVLNIFLREQGFSDPEIASYNSLRFIGALTFALPLGIYIRGKKLKPFFILAALIVPLTSVLIIESVYREIIPLIKFAFLLWGIGMMLMRVCSLPFIIRNTTSDNSTEALSLSASTWSLATIFSGIIISGLDWVNNLSIGNWILYFNERTILWIITTLSISALFFAFRISENGYKSNTSNTNILSLYKNYDWIIIIKALSPMIMISIGAGLTIPYVNLFFNSIFNLSSSQFSILGSITSFLVFIFSLMVPSIRKKYGYWFTIVVVQALSICCLIIMALMELYVSYPFALSIAITAFIFRQPLMHMAHPASNELLMNYVGEKNQELISALSSSLWSASWFISAKIFERLRLLDYRYYEIFLITAGLYIVGNIFFALLIKEYESNKIVSSANSIPLKDEITMD
ncbi:MAG: MFS transporter [Candidatus Marinimicrobia bacterium]|nr:MFS transporter [Candidatus Neomarinimicrobiota bacterium]